MEETIPVETEYHYSSLFYRDQDYTQTMSEGSEGVERVSCREVYVDGELVETVETGRETITPM